MRLKDIASWVLGTGSHGVLGKMNGTVLVLGREQKGVSLDKSCVAEIFNNFCSGCWEELNEEFSELCEINLFLNRPTMIDLDPDDDLVLRRDAKQNMLKYDDDKNKRRHELMNSDHWKHSISKITNGKRTHRSSAFSAYYWRNTFAMAEKDRPLNSLNDQDMNIFLKDVTAWVEGPLHCRFPWCKDVSVDRRFWESLVCLDPTKKARRVLVNYIWHVRPHDVDWAMVGGYFVQLLLQDLILSWYVDGTMYEVSWCDVEEAKIPEVMMHAKVFDQKGIDHTRYSISFTNAVNVPKQGGVFDDCGIWTCIFLYRLSHGLSLDVDNPIQTALTYREHMGNLF
nr:hypothetical protein [Tanacetum cinerariifolium]